MEATIENQDDEANEAIALWEQRCNALNDQIANIEHDHAIAQEELKTKVETLENDLLAKESSYNEVVQKMNQLTAFVEDKYKENETFQNELLASLDSEIEKQKKQAEIVQTISSDKSALFEELEKEKLSRQQMHDALTKEKESKAEIEANLCNTTKLLAEASNIRDQLEREKINVHRLHEEERKEAQSRIEQLQEEKQYLEESNEIDRAEAHEMRLIICQLENELKEANDALQSHLTDEVTARATEMASNALRDQLKESREKQSYEHEAYLCEKEARISAEQEVHSLQSDLALLLQVEKISGHDARVQQLTSKAAGEVLERQRSEIHALTKSLDELMLELQQCQIKEREAEERAANSRLHASACEHELLGAKSDIALLKEAMQLTKRDEFELQKTLESRVKSLEEDREALILTYGNELKNIKVEVSQVQMERDRLKHALYESEKANSAFVYSTSVACGDNESPLELEIAKLRLEKAQLLAAVQENGTKVEQRIRRACNGEPDSSSEKELIEAAEKSLRSLQQKYDETLAELKHANESNYDLMSRIKETNVSALTNDLNRVETEVGRLRQVNVELTMQLKQTKLEAESTNLKLEEKYRLAEAKIIDLERQERKEASLAVELAKVKNEAQSLFSPSNTQKGTTDGNKEGVGADDLHDFVLELKEVVTEERKMYKELLHEHEDLLALLAQQDLEKTSLQASLISYVGQEAVEKAIMEAEHQAVEQYGKYIRLR